MLICIASITYGQVNLRGDSVKGDTTHKRNSLLTNRQLQNRSYNINKQYDFNDLTRNIFPPHRKADTLKRRNGITVVPNVAANPTIGGQLGIKAVAGRRLGNDPNTLFSTAATSASITTKGIIYFYVNHNLFTPGNKYNFQGNLVAAKTVTPDYGFGIGRNIQGGSKTDSVLADPAHKVHAVHSH